MLILYLQLKPLTSELWNSLEVSKLIVAALTPVAVAILGVWVSRYLKRVEHLQWANQKIIEKRLQIYSDLAPILNDLYCYFDYIGDWKWKDPVSALGLKRTIDRLFYVNAPLFSEDLPKHFEHFIDLCFVPGPLDEFDSTALLKTDIQTRKEMFKKANFTWNSGWDNLFVRLKEDVTSREEIAEGYWALMNALSQELKAK